MNDVITLPVKNSSERTWIEVAYTLLGKMSPYGLVAVVGKACGIRSDGQNFFAIYDLPWIYPESFDWTNEAKKRLDTFLECDCSLINSPCAYHRLMMDQWMKEDELRNKILPEQVPKPLRQEMGPAQISKIN